MAPSGRARQWASSMYIPVLAIGRPTGIAPSTRSTRVKVDHTVVSVGPYIFQSSPHNGNRRSEEHTSELQSLMRISYAVFCLKKKKTKKRHKTKSKTQI